ncbi:hypothetical protein [Lysinibacillus sp. BW-2-10]|uniref:hypothetical protein n=1 Tax=Lysinibacillus sp. BW-2-10 TaxID=2590030 RepID=UPI0021060C3E|nr:hypothetical protein [Lysinibacillus sp. BW-2-10]
MYNSRKYLIIILSLILTICMLSPASHVEATVNPQELKKLQEENEKLKQRINSLEPAQPETLQNPPWETLQMPSNPLPITEVIQKGTKIPFDVIVDKPDYVRPAYEKHWHSSYGGGRWSYVPMRMHYALHRLFTTYDIGISAWYDFEHNIGFSVPMFQDPQALDLYIVAFQTEVTAVYTLGNQVVVVGNPKRQGVQVVTITTADIKPTNKDENLLVQLATNQGHEVDYSIISYVQPDFWAKPK